LCLALAVSGCTAGTIGIALGIYSLSAKEGGGGAVNLAPLAASNIEVRRESGEIVAIEYDLLDDDGGALTVAFAWWVVDAPGEVFPARGRNGRRGGADVADVDGDGAQRVRVEPNNLTRFRFEWRAREDIRRRRADPDSKGVSAAKVIVRITSTEEGTGKAVLETEPFVAGNDPPEILAFRADARSGVIPLVIWIADSTSDPVTIEARVMSKPISREDTAKTFQTGPRPGVEHKLFWNSEKDFGYRRGLVSIELVPKDLEEGPRFTQEIEVDNNSEPQVQIMDVAGSSDRSFEIPIRFILRDEESNRASVILQWAAAETGFEDLPFKPSQYVSDPIFLRDLLTSAAEEFAVMRRKLHILSEAPRVFRGVLDEADLSHGAREN